MFRWHNLCSVQVTLNTYITLIVHRRHREVKSNCTLTVARTLFFDFPVVYDAGRSLVIHFCINKHNIYLCFFICVAIEIPECFQI